MFSARQLGPTYEVARPTMLEKESLSSLLSQQSHNYSPEDLECMHKAFMRACSENPQMAATEGQRSRLAKAMVEIYQRHLSQPELIAAALSKVK